MTAKQTDRDKAEAAKAKVAEQDGWTEFDVILCPACNEPEFGDDIDPNAFVGETREAWQISPSGVIEADPDNPWDRICVTAEKIECSEGEQLRVVPHMHDFSMDVYQAWEEQLDEIENVRRRIEENAGLDDYA